MKRLFDWLRRTPVWRSIFRHGYPDTPRNRALAVSSTFFLHPHPVTMPRSGLQLSYTWCMGGLTFFLFLVEVVSGLFLMFYYRPTAELAYQDVVALRENVPLGVVRELHRWAGHLMVIAVWLHMFRVFLTGSYKPPREFNWNVGVALLVLTLFLSFTGYLLPWDQLSVWAVTVGTNMASATPLFGHQGPGSSMIGFGGIDFIHAGDDVRFLLLGGRFVGEAALLRFYVLHCVAVPLVAAVMMGLHFWRIRKDGGISRPL